MVRELNKSLQQHGFKSGEIHGDIDQNARVAELDRFKSGEINLLVASDVAARGLDIKGVSHVFNFDAPWHPDDYVHRIGRTGRAGATGKAYTFDTKNDAEAVDNIEKLIGTKIERLKVDGATSAGGAAERDEGPAPRGGEKRPRRGSSRTKNEAEPKAERAAPAPRAERAPARQRAERAPESAAEQIEQAPERIEQTSDRAERSPERTSRPDRSSAPRDSRGERSRGGRRQQDDEGPDDGWNGPMPGFLSVGFNSES
jgi:superfamily II DNA/RNA helicase